MLIPLQLQRRRSAAINCPSRKRYWQNQCHVALRLSDRLNRESSIFRDGRPYLTSHKQSFRDRRTAGGNWCNFLFNSKLSKFCSIHLLLIRRTNETRVPVPPFELPRITTHESRQNAVKRPVLQNRIKNLRHSRFP